MYRILLCCAGGMSTSLLVTKMQQYAEKEGIESEIWAVGATTVKEEAKNADIVLLGPQVRYLEATVKKDVAPKPVSMIDMRAYGKMDGEAVMKMAMKLLEGE